MSKKTSVSATTTLDKVQSAPTTPVAAGPSTHREALELLMPRMTTITKERFLANKVDVERAAKTALARARMLQELGTPALLSHLTVGKISPTAIEDTILAARASIELVTLERTADALSSEALVEPEILDEATQRKTRMLKVASYYFEAHPVFGLEIADIRQGTGYIDLASDLKRLAALYEHPQVAPSVKSDPKFYDPQDVLRSLLLAESIYDRVGESRDRAEQKRSMQVAQAWVLLNDAWEQVRRAVTFLYFEDPALVSKFPSLYSIGRGPRTTGKGVVEQSDDSSTADEPVTAPAKATEAPSLQPA